MTCKFRYGEQKPNALFIRKTGLGDKYKSTKYSVQYFYGVA